MPHINVAAAVFPLTVGGTTTGYVTIDPNSDLLPNTKVWVWSSGAGIESVECLVTEFNDDGTVGLRILPQDSRDHFHHPSYGRNDMSAFTVADGSQLMVNPQIVPVEAFYGPKV